MNKYRKDVEYYLYNRNNIKTSLDKEGKPGPPSSKPFIAVMSNQNWGSCYR
jgi:hypothetical protein